MTLEMARAKGEDGMRRAAAHAEADAPGWTDVAFAFIVKFALKRPPAEHFTGEDLVDLYATDSSLVQPENTKAWGGPIQKALRSGFISEVPGAKGRRRKGNGSRCAVYYSRIFGRRATDLFGG